MRQIFSYDGPLMSALTKIGDCLCLSALWLVFSLPIITLGASTTALYAATYHCLRENQGGVWRSFWDAFREDFKRATLTGLVALALCAVLTVDVFVFRSLKIEGRPMGNLYYVVLAVWCLGLTWAVYLAAYTARLTGNVRQTLRAGYLLMVLHPARTAGVLATVLVGLALMLLAPILVLIAPAAGMLICSFPMEKTFRAHLSPEDTENTPQTETEGSSHDQ